MTIYPIHQQLKSLLPFSSAYNPPFKWLLWITILLPTILNAQSETAVSIQVNHPENHARITDATVMVNGQPASLNTEKLQYEALVPSTQPAKLRIEFSGAETLEMTFFPSSEKEMLTVSLGPEGSQYVQFVRNDILALRPDDSRIGIAPKGKVKDDWATSPELQNLLKKLGLKVVENYVDTDIRQGSVPDNPNIYTSLVRIDRNRFDDDFGQICEELNAAGYEPGIFLRKGQSPLSLFRGSVKFSGFPKHATLNEILAKAKVKLVGNNQTNEIRFTPNGFPPTISDWMQNLQTFWNLNLVQWIELEALAFTYLLEK